MFDRGYVTLGRYRGAPIKLHWTIVLGLLWVSGLSFAPGAWAAYLLVILLHEMGHAFLARRYGLAVKEIMIHGLGGHCAYVGYPTLYQQSVIASGGVVAQAFLLAIFWPLAWLLPPGGAQQAGFFSVMTLTNLYLLLFNLIPIPPLDGHLIAKLPGLWRKARRERALSAIERDEVERQRVQRIAHARARAAGVELVDERAVKDLVKKALEDAKRAAKERSN
jgi:stage IV sporulation protein FB